MQSTRINLWIDVAVEGMKIIYSTDDSGKSGCIRVLKMVFGATYCEDIKPNIYKTQKTNPGNIIIGKYESAFL